MYCINLENEIKSQLQDRLRICRNYIRSSFWNYRCKLLQMLTYLHLSIRLYLLSFCANLDFENFFKIGVERYIICSLVDD